MEISMYTISMYTYVWDLFEQFFFMLSWLVYSIAVHGLWKAFPDVWWHTERVGLVLPGYPVV